jgi:hypothetical protein
VGRLPRQAADVGPAVGFGTGGIRISHATDISGPVTVALTVKRGKRKPFVVQSLVIAAPKPAAPALTADELLPYEQTGDERAKEIRAIIEKSMTPEQIAEAMKLAREIFEWIEAKKK